MMDQEHTPSLRVLIVEDHELLAQSLRIAFDAESVEADVASLQHPNQLISAVQASLPDVVLLDLELGGHIGDGARLVRPLAATGAAVVVVTAVTDRSRLAATLEDGAAGFLCKSEPFDVLLDTVRQAARGESNLSDTERQQLLLELRRHRRLEHVRRQAFERLTPREREVLEALATGRTVGCMAAQWVVAEATVRTQVRGVLTKLGVTSQLEAVVLATRSGWLEHDQATAWSGPTS